MSKSQAGILAVALVLGASMNAPAFAGPPAAVAADPADAKECEVYLKLAFKKDGCTPAPDVRSEDICIKRTGENLKISDQIKLFFTDTLAGRFGSFCYGHKRLDITNKEKATAASAARVDFNLLAIIPKTECQWNGHYNNGYPFDIIFWTTKPEPLSRYIKLIRILRNGKLAFSWNGIEQSNRGLFIKGTWLKAMNLPHLADFDLRITGPGVQIPEEIINAKAVPRVTEWQLQLGRMKVAVDASVSTLAPTTKKHWACVQWHVRALEDAAHILSGSLTPVASCDFSCRVPKPRELTAVDSCPTPNVQSAGLTPLRDLYEKYKTNTAEEAQNKVRDELKKFGIAAKLDLQPLLAQLRTELGSNPTIDKAHEAIEKLDMIASHSLSITDQLIGSTLEIRESIVQLGKDSAQQAKLVSNIADTLEKEPSVFEARVANPPAFAGEQELHMEYGDRHQYFLLTPWNLVSFRLTQNPGTTPGWENLIPAIDLVGYRFQWAKSRFADMRIGIGGYMAKDALPDVDAAGQATTKDVYNFGLELNLGLGGFKFGVGYLLTNSAGQSGLEPADRVRVLIGADLVKLITGRNLEVL